MNLITQQNYELSAELQRFLQTDEVVKKKLNRKTVVDDIKYRVDTAIKKSQNEVNNRRSPLRGSKIADTTSAAMQSDYRQSMASTNHMTRGATSSHN